MRLGKSLGYNISKIKHLSHYSQDICYFLFSISECRCAAVWCEGMSSMRKSRDMVIGGIKRMSFDNSAELISALLGDKAVTFGTKKCTDTDELFREIMSGSTAVIADGCDIAVLFPTQGYSYRAVSESYTEENVRSSREGFAEPIKINISLIRRRLKTPDLVFKTFSIGKLSDTEIAIAYISGRADEKLIDNVTEKLKNIKIDMVLESGFIEPFLETEGVSLFSSVGRTERPDTFCGKLKEGRIGILVDGTPFALIVPFLFDEFFFTFDDYSNKSYFASITRIIKYFTFVLSFVLPGLYVAVVNFAPEMLPSRMLFTIYSSQLQTPFSLMTEAIFIHFLYEIVREAGLRLPRPIGHAVSLVGALVVGDAAVQAGIVSSPMVMTVALTAVCSFTVPMLYEPVSLLRLVFILLGGCFGIVGISFGLSAVLICISSIYGYGVASLFPFSPYNRTLFNDGLIRSDWTSLSRRSDRI